MATLQNFVTCPPPNGHDVAILIAEIAVAFPNKRIMLIGTVLELTPIWTKLTRVLPHSMIEDQQLTFVHSRQPLHLGEDDVVPRLICCTPIEASTVESEKCDIVILHDANACMHEQMKWLLIQPDLMFRMFGLQHAGRVLKPYQQARLAQVFGFDKLELSTAGRVRRDTHLAWVRCGGRAPDHAVQIEPVVCRSKGHETVNRMAAYVHHHARNDLICRLAKKLRNADPIEGERWKDVRNWLTGRDYRPLSVTVVVSNLDHALQLGRRLADWPIIAGDSNLHGFGKSVKQRIELRPSQWLPCAIVVASAAREYPGYHSDVVILASGGVSSKEIPEYWLYAIRNPERPLLIVDFLDDFSRITRDWSFRRRESFALRDIFLVGISPVMGRVQRFLELTGNPS